MSKPKPATTPKKPAAESSLIESPQVPSPLVLTAADQELFGRVVKFLVNIQTEPYATKARREGYTIEEHREGWRLFKVGSGETRPLEHLFAETASAGGVEGAEKLRLLQEVDNFENKWFPRTRGIIRRVVPRDRRDAFAEAFFQSLVQQPLGPAVIGSVGTFLSRVDGLAKSDNPDAKKVHKTLNQRGLTEEKIKQVRSQLTRLEAGEKKAAPPKVSAAHIEKAQQEQREAIEDLRDWFNDWGTTLRPTFNVKEQIKLGLTTFKRSATGEEEVVEEGTGDEQAGDEQAGDEEPKDG